MANEADPIIAVPYEEEVRNCVDCSQKVCCRVLFKAKRVEQNILGAPVDAKFLCFNCADLKLRHSLKIKNTPFISGSEETYVWTELKITNNGNQFYE
jgi:hypothetical protein